MTKLAKQYYFNAKGEKKVNCYKLTIPKQVLIKSNIKENDEIALKVNNGNIVIEKKL